MSFDLWRLIDCLRLYEGSTNEHIVGGSASDSEKVRAALRDKRRPRFVEGCLSGPGHRRSEDIVSPSPPGNAKTVLVACTSLVHALVPLVRLWPAVPRFCVPDRQGSDPGLSELQEMLEGRWNPLRAGCRGSTEGYHRKKLALTTRTPRRNAGRLARRPAPRLCNCHTRPAP